MSELQSNSIQEKSRVRNIPIGIFELVWGSSVAFVSLYIVNLASNAPILKKSFEPAQLMTYGIGTAGAIVAVTGLVAIVDGVRDIRGKYITSKKY